MTGFGAAGSAETGVAGGTAIAAWGQGGGVRRGRSSRSGSVGFETEETAFVAPLSPSLVRRTLKAMPSLPDNTSGRLFIFFPA